MKVFILYYHPEPKSFNNAMFNTAVDTLKAEGHEVRTSDLHEMGFNPISGRHNFTTVKDPNFLNLPVEEAHATKENGFAEDIEQEIQKMEWCDLMIIQTPIWWMDVPAMVKGWIDRVFARRRTYGHSKHHDVGVFDGKKALVSTTTGVPQVAYEKFPIVGNMEDVLRPLQAGVFEFTGFSVLQPQIVYGVLAIEEEARKQALDQYAERLKSIDSEDSISAKVQK